MKRRQSNRIIKSKKLFEDLSNELIYEIFDYFDYCFLVETFSKLNLRFQSLVINSSLKINLPLTSKSTFQYRCKYIITPNLNRIISLNISKYFLEYFSIHLFSSLKSLTIHQISSEQISLLITHLTSLTNFSSLSIHSLNYFQDENSVYLSIFNLLNLKFCKLTFPSGGERVPLPISINQYSALEYLILNGHCRLDQLISILSYTPKLRHLSCQHLYGSGCTEKEIPLNLTSICLTQHRISFDELKLFLTKISSRLKKLRIRISNDDDYIHAEKWEELILNYMPCLQIFDLQYSVLMEDDDRKILIDRFSSKFWMERKWVFDYYYYKNENSCYVNFFSIVPYRFNHFILYEQINDNTYRINFARHLTIEGQFKANQCLIQFPRVHKLTLNIEENPSFIHDINSLIPLTQITNLNIKDKQFSINHLIEILHSLPNLQSLTLSNTLPFESKRKFSSRNNQITKLIIDDDECELKHIHFLIYLFPYLEYLEIGINENNLQDILRYLLLKSKYLFSLLLLNINYNIIEKMKTLIQNEKLIHDYTIERIHGGLFLWW